jgi:hypothetical protein
MPQKPLPALDLLSQRLARNNRRIGRTLDQLPTIAAQLVAAWQRQDQRGLKELSQQLLAAARGESSLYAVACELDDHIAAADMASAQRTLLALLGEVGALKSRGIIPARALPAAPTA